MTLATAGDPIETMCFPQAGVIGFADVPEDGQRLMLGVRRSSIADALHPLEGVGAIRGLRGLVLVRDRAHLERLAEGSDGSAETELTRLLPTQPDDEGLERGLAGAPL